MRLFGRRSSSGDNQLKSAATVSHNGTDARGEPVRLTGTTTFGAENLERVFAAHGKSLGGVLELSGWLIAEPSNPADANAIAVHVEGERIGYLPGHLAARISLGTSEPYPCRVQLWAEQSEAQFRVIGWVAAGSTSPKWPHNLENPPAISTKDERVARSAAITKMVDDALNGQDPIRAEQFAAGMVGGYHYLELIEPIKELKRQGRLEEALVVCYKAIEGAEGNREGREPAPGYTIEAAIIHRKLGQRDQEIAVLERWLRLCPKEYREDSRVNERLMKLRNQIAK
jgi:hypothetical protein